MRTPPSPLVPQLTIHGVKHSRSATAWDLTPLLYKGGAGANVRKVKGLIAEGHLGNMILQRLPAIQKIYDAMNTRVIEGYSYYTIRELFISLRLFYDWADNHNTDITANNINSNFSGWADHLLNLVDQGRLKMNTAYGKAKNAAMVLDSALEPSVPLMHNTRLSKSSRSTSHRFKDTNNASIQESRQFCQMLMDIIDSLDSESVLGPLPVILHFRNGKTKEEWSGLIPPAKLKKYPEIRMSLEKHTQAVRQRWIDDQTLRTRYPLINLRVGSELLIFISQTGMNLAQAHQLKRGSYSFQSFHDGYQVSRVYKDRRKGEVEFFIYSEYRPAFERYLSWLKLVIPDDLSDKLFPLWSPHGRADNVLPSLHGLTRTAKVVGIKFVGARTLRTVRSKWLARISKSTEIAAEMGQHLEQTFLSNYDSPDLLSASVEITRFYSMMDHGKAAPGPGMCTQIEQPKSISSAPIEAPKPDCLNPAGCLFCQHQRDIDTDDHFWSIASYRYLKIIELSRYRPSNQILRLPSMAVVERLTEKLSEIANTNSEYKRRVGNAIAKVEEFDFHPRWEGLIFLMEN